MAAIPPKLAGVCDCHMHIYDPRFAPQKPASIPQRQATVADYRRVRERLGLERVVIVQPTGYGTDNSCTLDAMAQLGDCARGVAVVAPDVADAELERLTHAGIRGLRYVMFSHGTLTWDSLSHMASRIAPFGWNINLQLSGETLAAHEAVLSKLECDLVIDHIARFTAPVSDETPGVKTMHRLLDAGRCWVKLSAPYHGSKSGPPRYEDIGAIARELVKRWPERMLYATNWPHPSVKGEMPDDVELMRLVEDWAGDERTRRKILVENPARLYGFG
jgi:D-galactarolactone isomerase